MKDSVNDQITTTTPGSNSGIKTFWLIIGLVIISLLLRDVPFLSMLFAPFTQFETMLHEMSHALACVMTGGWVSGLTIVEDGNGHGGLTYTHGGIPFIYSQAGYIGETLWGCLLIALSRFPRISRYVLMGLGVSIGLACIYFMPGALLINVFQAIGSLIWGLAIAGGLVWAGKKLSNRTARMVLMFLAVQSCLTSLQGVWILLLQSFGFFPGVTFSDATNMAKLTGIPAPFWGICWATFSVVMLSWAMWMTYKADRHENANGMAKEKKSAQLGSAAAPHQIESTASIEYELEALRQKVDLGQPVKIKQPKDNKQRKK